MGNINDVFAEMESRVEVQKPVNDVLEIDIETREIYIPDTEALFGVENDAKAERKYFKCPRKVGNNIDLSELELYVVFQNASNMEEGKDRYHVTDVKTTSDGYITFSWELSAKVTAYKGDVQFVVCAIKTDSSGVKQNVWNTTIAIGKCLIGLSSDMSASEEQSASDLYTQLISELNSTASAKLAEVTTQIQTVGNNQVSNVNNAGTTQVSNLQNKGTEVLASIPDTYTELDASVKQLNEQIRGKAPVITESTTIQSGSPTTVTDSAEMPLQDMVIYGKSLQKTTTGKNLINADEYYSQFKQSDGTYKAKTVTLNDIRISLSEFVGKEITISVKLTVGANVSSVFLMYISSEQKKINGSAIKSGLTGKSTLTVTPVSNTDYFVISFGSGNDDVIFSELQLELGSVATSYEPYTGGKPSPSPEYPQEIVSVGGNGSIGVEITGKNLFGGKAFADKIVELGGSLNETNKTVAVSAKLMSDKVIYNFPDSSKQYTVILHGSNSSVGVSTKHVNARIEYKNGSKYILEFENNEKVIVTTQKNAVGLISNYNNGTTIFDYERCGIFEGVLKETDFEPYKQPQSLQIATPTGLPAIQVPSDTSGITYTDADGQAWISDGIDFSKGKYIQRVWKAEFDGSEDEKWLKGDANYISNECLPVNMNDRKGFCNQYIVGNNIRGIKIGDGTKALIVFDDFSDENALSNFKAHLASNPLSVMTYLDTPIETDLTEAQIQAYKSLTTFKPTSIISNDAGVQMNVEYACDTKTWVTNKITKAIQSATGS